VIDALAELTGKRPSDSPATGRAFRVIADHMRSSVFVLGDDRGVLPGNLGQGYVLRRLIRRTVRYGRQLGLAENITPPLAERLIDQYAGVYPEVGRHRERVLTALAEEEQKFEKTLSRGMAELDKVLGSMRQHGQTVLSGRVAFRLYDTCGFPLEFTEEICAEHGFTVDRPGFDKAFEKHRNVSRQGADKAFKGGLADASEATTRLHTATHLLQKSLQLVLGEHVQQKGSNITAARLRFDFSHPAKMTPEEIQRVEEIVNEAIAEDLPVSVKTMPMRQARECGATALFTDRYDEQVKVYSIGGFSMEVCGGPHVARTGELGRFRIVKEESSSAGVRRIRAVLEAA
jgi:alanyl-tRNA synthetase